jgi:hypothetical protein
MTTVASAKRYGAQTQAAAAAYFAANGWPYATDVGAGRNGSDILNVPGLAVEVKGRADFAPLAWLRQAKTGAPGLPLCIVRPKGMGVASVADWLMMLRVGDGVELLRAAGYGDPPVHVPVEPR